MISRTTTQIDLMMKTIMVVLFVFGLFVFFVDVTKAAQWVENPANCATQSPGGDVVCQTPETPDSRVCGVNGSNYYCFPNVATFSAPSFPSMNSTTQSLRGGYIINCEAYDAAPVSGPFCDNTGVFWCNASSTCRDSLFRTTTCVAGKWAYESGATTCGDCDASHLDCNLDGGICEITKHSSVYGAPSLHARYGNTCVATDAECITNYYDCDASNPESGNGCEIYQGDSCTTGGGEPGTYNGCTCIVIPPKNFITASNTTYYSTSPLLWGTQLGTGDLLSFSNATSSNIFIVKNDGTVFMTSTASTSSVQNQFYNYNGDLYWGETKLNTGGGVYTNGSGLNLSGYEFSVSTTQDFNWAGQHTFNSSTVFSSTTTFPLGVWGTDGKIGIGTTTPLYKLSLVVDNYDGIVLFNTSGQMMAGIGPWGSNAGLALYHGTTGQRNVSLNSDKTSFINNGHNFGIGTTTPNSAFTLVGDLDIAGNGLLKFNNVYGTIDQVIKINSAGFPEWVNTSSLGIPTFSLPFGFGGETLVNEGGTSWVTTSVFRINTTTFSIAMNNSGATGNYSVALGAGNFSSGDYTFTAGGSNNILGASPYSSIVGGSSNGIGGGGQYNFIGGGNNNIVQNGSHASIVGGSFNHIFGENSSIIGGEYNLITGTGDFAFALGSYTTSSGQYSLVMGSNIEVNGDYSFGLNVSTTPVVLNQANAIALMGGNVGIGTTSPSVTLAVDGEMLVTETSTMHDVVPEEDKFSLGTAVLRWLNGFFKNLFADEATIASSTLTNTNIGTSTIENATIISSTIINLNATNATFTAQVAFQATSTHDSGIRSNLYCDINGTNCFDPSIGWVIPITDVTTTIAVTSGSFSYSGKVGYQAANEICDSAYPGYHFCFSGEIISFIRTGDVSKFTGLPQAWIAEGPPGYTAYANDCGGYTTSSISYLGAFWEYTGTTGGGQGWLSNCSSNKAISCCK